MQKNKFIEVAIGALSTEKELVSAYKEIQRESRQIPSIHKNGVFVGSTSPGGEGFWAAFDGKGFFLNTLDFIREDAWTFDGRLDGLMTPGFILGLEGTAYENRAVELSKQLALCVFNGHELDRVLAAMDALRLEANK